jgi:hypothetical protein
MELALGGGAGIWRADAGKAIILITDAPPGGPDDAYTEGVDDVAALNAANLADSLDIRIGAILTGFFISDVGSGHHLAEPTKQVMRNYANATGGAYVETDSDEASDAILNLLDSLCLD